MKHLSHYIAGDWVEGTGAEFQSHEPSTGEVNGTCRAATLEDVTRAVSAARTALPAWSQSPLGQRIDRLNAFAQQLREHRDELRETVCRETGKPRWEAAGEVDSMIAKVPISIDAHAQRCRTTSIDVDGAAGVTRFKPHGVAVVLGPFNFPGHLPNGHIVPALLAGNTVVFKPSEMTPLTAVETVKLWERAGLPPGAINLVHGAGDVGAALVRHEGIDAVYFTGSDAGGRAISRALADRPGVVTALEMGGNNPLVVHDVRDLEAAAYLTIQSSYLSAGQRCSCARRLIVTGDADRFIERLVAMIRRVRVGAFTDTPEPFMGPVISPAAAKRLLDAQRDLLERGGTALAEMRPLNAYGTLLTPGLMDVTAVKNRADVEHFGPLLQLIRVPDLDAAIAEANHTRYGLAAGILSDDRGAFERFYREVRAGVINWNRALTGASSRLPFGGVGCSGNGRPSGAWAADYCSYPVASLEVDTLAMPAKRSPGIGQ